MLFVYLGYFEGSNEELCIGVKEKLFGNAHKRVSELHEGKVTPDIKVTNWERNLGSFSWSHKV